MPVNDLLRRASTGSRTCIRVRPRSLQARSETSSPRAWTAAEVRACADRPAASVQPQMYSSIPIGLERFGA
eukprot:6890915-Alexandrium_andersonii.AAC.1